MQLSTSCFINFGLTSAFLKMPYFLTRALPYEQNQEYFLICLTSCLKLLGFNSSKNSRILMIENVLVSKFSVIFPKSRCKAHNVSNSRFRSLLRFSTVYGFPPL